MSELPVLNEDNVNSYGHGLQWMRDQESRECQTQCRCDCSARGSGMRFTPRPNGLRRTELPNL